MFVRSSKHYTVVLEFCFMQTGKEYICTVYSHDKCPSIHTDCAVHESSIFFALVIVWNHILKHALLLTNAIIFRVESI